MSAEARGGTEPSELRHSQYRGQATEMQQDVIRNIKGF